MTYGIVFVNSKRFHKEFVDLITNLFEENPPLLRRRTFRDEIDSKHNHRIIDRNILKL